MNLRIVSIVFPLMLAGCTVREGLIGTFSTLSTVAGARKALASFPAFKTLDEAPACVVAETVRQGSDSVIRNIDTPPPLSGIVDLTDCGPLTPADLQAASAFLVSGPLDTVIGVMVTADYQTSDPAAFGVACAVIEGVRASGLSAFRGALEGGGKIAWTAPDPDPAACLARQNARALAMLAEPTP